MTSESVNGKKKKKMSRLQPNLAAKPSVTYASCNGHDAVTSAFLSSAMKSRLQSSAFILSKRRTFAERSRSCRVSRHTIAADPLKVLFFGRDEFSCIVLEHLFRAQGMMSPSRCTNRTSECLACIELWSSIDVVTTPDVRVGRRGSKLSICEFWCAYFVFAFNEIRSVDSTTEDLERTPQCSGPYNSTGEISIPPLVVASTIRVVRIPTTIAFIAHGILWAYPLQHTSKRIRLRSQAQCSSITTACLQRRCANPARSHGRAERYRSLRHRDDRKEKGS